MTAPPDEVPIGNYGFLSDTHTAALVGPDGAVEWMCAPRFDGPAFLARILDRRRGGAFELELDGRLTARRYLSRTFVLESDWTGPSGTAVVTDALATRSDPGGDPDQFTAPHVLVRRVGDVSGRIDLRVRLDLRPDWGRATPRWLRDGPGWREEVSGVAVRADVPLELDGDQLVAGRSLAAGDSATFLLGYADAALDGLDPVELLADTARAWQEWSAGDTLDEPLVAGHLVERSSMILRALSFDETGALLAAPTTSLPEKLGGVRNWDYRFTWHRDAAQHVLALLRLGHTGLGRRYLRFLLDDCVRPGERLRPMAGLRGEQDGDEVELEHLAGYAGSRPVRIGNEAFEQVQLDSYGHVLDAAYAFATYEDELTDDDWHKLADLVATVVDTWREPDHGLWEMRDEPRHYTNSKVLAWVALDRGVRLAEEFDRDAPLDRWCAEREAIHADVLEHGWDQQRGAFTIAYGSPELDASLLRVPLVGFLPGDDPRVVATIDRVLDELNGERLAHTAVGPEAWALVHRYDPERVDDGVGGGEGAFLLCSFEAVSALVLAGRAEEARERFDAIVGRAGPLGLFAESMSADGMLVGNYPQALTHLALIEAAANLSVAGSSDALHDWALRDRD